MNGIFFKGIMSKIQSCYNFDAEIITTYFSYAFKQISKSTKRCKNLNIPITTFVAYLNMPQHLCKKIFLQFTKKSKGILSKEMFIEGMKKLYFGTIEELTEMIFHVFENEIGSNEVNLDNFLISFKNLTSDNQEISNFEKNLKHIGNTKITYESFKNHIFYRDVKVLTSLLKLIYERQPFDSKVLDFFKLLNNNSLPPNDSLSTDENLTDEKCSKKFLSIGEEKVDFYLCRKGKLKKHRFIKTESNLIVFKKNQIDRLYEFNSIIPLNNYFFIKSEKTIINNEKFYSAIMQPKYQKGISTDNNTVLIRSKTKFKKFLNFINANSKLEDLFNEHKLKSTLQYDKSVHIFVIQNTKTHEKKVMKVLKKSVSRNELILNEVEALQILKSYPHKNIIKVYDIFENSNNVFIIMEYLQQDFNHFLKDHKLCYEEKIKIVNEIAQGMSYLHSKRIVHRDLKFENILIELDQNNQPIVKLIDFGLSKVLYHNEKASESFGTLVYTAPEILQKKFYDFSVDVWSFGVVLYHLFKNRLPFDGKEVTYVVDRILFDNSPIESLKKTSKQMDLLISKCLEKDPTKRFNFINILDFLMYEVICQKSNLYKSVSLKSISK